MGKCKKLLFLTGLLVTMIPIQAHPVFEKDIFLVQEEKIHWTENKKASFNLVNSPYVKKDNISPEILFDIKKDEKTMYATTSVNIRKLPSKDSDKLGILSFAQGILQLGVCNNGWSQVLYNDEPAYINTTYLQDTKPEPKIINTYNGIIQKEGNVPDSRLLNIESYYTKLPQNIRTHLETLGWKYICSDADFGSRYGFTESILALSVYDEKVIYIDNRQKAEDAILHEVGHAIDWSLGFVSYKKEFADIFYAEVETFRTISNTHTNNTCSPIEYFAEAFAWTITDPALMQEKCPTTYNYIIEKINTLE